MEWQPIETAPKDGTKIILLPWGDLDDLFTSWWIDYDDRWANNPWAECTHWRPLPAPPTAEEISE